MKKYLAFDGINNDHAQFNTIEEARKYLENIFFDEGGEGYSIEMIDCAIYELKQTVAYDVIDSKENYQYENEEDIPEDDTTSEAWPYDNAHDEIWQHKFNNTQN